MTAPKFAPVAPLPIHKQLDAMGMLGDYHLLLTHQVLEDTYEYANFWRLRDAFVIMDNSAAEFGESLPWQKVIDAARICDANVVVLPDKIGDTAQTIQWAKEYIRHVPQDMGKLGVAQGRTYEEVEYCARVLLDLGVDMLSIPRGITFEIGTRVDLVRWLGENTEVPLHLLGFSNNILDDMAAALSAPNVRGIDSAVPIWLPHLLPSTPPANADFGKRPEDYDQWQSIPHPDTALTNLGVVRWWLAVAGATAAPTPAHEPSAPEVPPTVS